MISRMEKKTAFVILFIAFIISCNSIDNSSNGTSKDNFDTIFFASNDCIQQNPKAFLVEGTTKEQNFILLKSIAKESNIWVDSILFEKKGRKTFFSIIREPTRNYYVLYYNGDSLIEKKISRNLPKIYINEYGDSLVVVTKDSIYNSGYLNFLNFKYTLSDSCMLLKEESSFPKIPINHE